MFNTDPLSPSARSRTQGVALRALTGIGLAVLYVAGLDEVFPSIATSEEVGGVLLTAVAGAVLGWPAALPVALGAAAAQVLAARHGLSDGAALEATVTVGILLLTAAGSSTLYSRRLRAIRDLRDLTLELERRVGERTAELASTNASLAQEMSERQRVQEEMERSERRFRSLVENSSDLTVILADDGRLTYVSPSLERLLGWRLEEVIGRPFTEYFHPDHVEPASQSFRDLLAGPARAVQAQYVLRHADGSWVTLQVTTQNLLGDPAVRGVVCNARDVTEREEVLERLSRSERDYRGLFENAQDAILVLDPAGEVVLDANPAACAVYGRALQELVGLSMPEISQDAGPGGELTTRVLTTGGPVRFETVQYRGDGSELHLEVVWSAMEYGGEVAILSINRDITERVLIRRELHRSVSLLQATLESTADGIVVVGLDQRMVDWNHRFLEMWGLSPQDLLEDQETAVRGVGAQLADAEGFAQAIRQLASDPEAESLDIVRLRDGRVFECYTQPQRLGRSVVGRVWSYRDVTERVHAEEALRASDERFRQIAENIREVFYIVEAASREVLYVSPAYDELWGRPRAELASNPDAWLGSVHPEDREGLWSRDGMDGERQSTYRLVRPDGEIRWIRSRGFPVRDPAGRVYRIAGFAEDITEHVRAEEALRETQQHLLQAQKMEAVGRLAGGIAHDFNNLLMAISGHAELLQSEPALPEASRWQAEEIHKAAARAAGLTRQLLAFSRRQVLQPRPLSINAVVGDMEGMLRRLIGQDVRLLTFLNPGIGVVRADPGQLEQVLMNLAVNARDAMPEGGTLTIQTANVALNGGESTPDEEVLPGPYVMLAVSDTGKGMDAAVQQRIFEPFFTTKPQGKGTGLGLSTVYGIVRQSGGHVRVHSEPGRGAAFRVYLPRADAPHEAELPGTAAPPPRRGTETILLVEDDDVVRRLLRMFLERHGYTVLDAADGDDALRLEEEHTGDLNLLLTDVVMPGMNGRELARRIKERRDGVRVVFMSGYTDDAILQHGVLDAGSEFVQKPVSPDVLARRIRTLLDAP